MVMANELTTQTPTALTPVNHSAAPRVHVKDGKVFANSRDVAEFFGKEHKNVLRDILSILDSGVVERPTPNQLKSEPINVWFFPVQYIDARGRQQVSYDMTRDGFTLLVMGYTGPKTMEEALRNPTPALPDFSNPAIAASAWAEQYEARQMLEAKTAR